MITHRGDIHASYIKVFLYGIGYRAYITRTLICFTTIVLSRKVIGSAAIGNAGRGGRGGMLWTRACGFNCLGISCTIIVYSRYLQFVTLMGVGIYIKFACVLFPALFFVYNFACDWPIQANLVSKYAFWRFINPVEMLYIILYFRWRPFWKTSKIAIKTWPKLLLAAWNNETKYYYWLYETMKQNIINSILKMACTFFLQWKFWWRQVKSSKIS